MNYGNGFILTVALIAGLYMPQAVQARHHSLDGRQYQVTLTENGQSLGSTVIGFSDGYFWAASHKEQGFHPGRYNHNSRHFHATERAGHHQKAQWHGTFKGNTVHGYFHWRRSNGHWTHVEFEGTLVVAAPPAPPAPVEPPPAPPAPETPKRPQG